MITINGFVGGDHFGEQRHGIVSGMPVSTSVNTTLKIAFQITTGVGPGLEFFLCAGTLADFNAGNTALQLASVTGPGTQTLTIIDTDQLAGKLIYVLRRGTGLAPFVIHFTLNVE